MVKISERLKMAASLVSDGNVLADVGTDHGYVPIYLLQQQRIPRAIAMDINRGPLERADEHIKLYGMTDYIETRLSDGVAAIHPGEADTILIAGMGGGLVIHILTAGEEGCKAAKELVLQPQSELERVRRFLAESGYVLEAEEMVKEEGKYYPMMRVHYEPDAKWCEDEVCEVFYQYGEMLIKQKHPVLLDYLKKEEGIQREILQRLQAQPMTEPIATRIGEVEQVLRLNSQARAYYK